MKVNLHELINAPHGSAERALRAAGLWRDPPPGEGGEAFRVRVKWSVDMDDEIEVLAETPDAARKLAIEMVKNEWSGEGHVEINSAWVRE